MDLVQSLHPFTLATLFDPIEQALGQLGKDAILYLQSGYSIHLINWVHSIRLFHILLPQMTCPKVTTLYVTKRSFQIPLSKNSLAVLF